ncbi:DNA replication complex GINS protein SLD5-like [Bolinopsis microptera]|uniref:DNA replication complex GINS protein SLD5-like n=1 Tax=Bolinopsis microptera TaxID=2820187 RepID=UPI003078F0F2
MDISLNDTGNDEEYEQLTAAQVLQRLEEYWVNERLSPYLLETQQEVVDCLLEQCQTVENNFPQASSFAVGIHQLEIQRIKYMVTDYVRCRLKKIEQHAEYALEEELVKDDQSVPHLSPSEFVFAREFHRNTQNHFSEIALKHMPSAFQKLGKQKSMTVPNLNTFIFFKVKEDVNDVQIDPRETPVDLSKDEIHISKYLPIAPLLEQSKLKLV